MHISSNVGREAGYTLDRLPIWSISSFLFHCCLVYFHLLLQPEAPAASSLHGSPRPEEEDDGDLNKALGVQRFQQILTPAAAVPDKEHHIYHDEDIECERAEAS